MLVTVCERYGIDSPNGTVIAPNNRVQEFFGWFAAIYVKRYTFLATIL
jgi:hypothetical protein